MFSGFGCLSQFSQKFFFAKAGVVALEVYTRNGLINQWLCFGVCLPLYSVTLFFLFFIGFLALACSLPAWSLF